MSHIGKVTSKGQTTLPAKVRAELGIVAGDRLRYSRLADGSFRIERLSGSFADLKGLVKLKKLTSTEDILEAVDAARRALGGADGRS